MAQTNWHELPAEQATGLGQAEVEARLRQFGLNQMTAQRRLSEWKRFLLQFHQPLICILLAATGITVALGEWVNESVIFGVVFINAIIGNLQEAKAALIVAAQKAGLCDNSNPHKP